jgi:hypothetical protein
MRPSRMTILGLAGLAALHVFMLAGHGRGYDAPIDTPQMGAAGMVQHASSPTSPPRLTRLPGDEDATGMDMTVACLAVLAGLLLLMQGRRDQMATAGPQRPTVIRSPARLERAGPRTRSPTELCISLT